MRVRAVSMPVRFVRVPIEVMGAADFCSAVSFVARARGASFEGERGGGCRRGEGWVPARARRLISDAVSSKPEEGSRRSRIIDRCL